MASLEHTLQLLHAEVDSMCQNGVRCYVDHDL